MLFRKVLLSLFMVSILGSVAAQSPYSAYVSSGEEVVDGEDMISFELKPVVKFSRAIDARRYARLINNIKIVYPIAQQVRVRLAETEAHLETFETERQQREYIKQVEAQLKEEYTPVLKRMTFSQGKVLIKLVDRETNRTSYELVKELRGSFSAFFWQGIARIFGADLKAEYDKEGDDKMIERLIILYELGLI